MSSFPSFKPSADECSTVMLYKWIGRYGVRYRVVRFPNPRIFKSVGESDLV